MAGPETVKDLMNLPRPGRPSKLTDDTRERLFNALLGCCTIRDACAYAGIGVTTFEVWKERGEADLKAGKHTEFTKFLKQCQDVIEMAKPRLILLLSKGAQKDPKLALTILERRYPKEWAHREYVETRDHTGEPEEVDENDIIRRIISDPDRLRQLEAIAQDVHAEGEPGKVGPDGEHGEVVEGEALGHP